jgi:hypothetical protein
MFLNQMLSIGISADDEILLCKVNKFACCYHEIEKDGFRFSLGWFYSLKKRYNIEEMPFPLKFVQSTLDIRQNFLY